MDIHSPKAKDKKVYMCRVIWKWLILYTMTLSVLVLSVPDPTVFAY